MKKLISLVAVSVLALTGCGEVQSDESIISSDPYRSRDNLEKVAEQYWKAVSDGKWEVAYKRNTIKFRRVAMESEFLKVRDTCYKQMKGKKYKVIDANISLSNFSLGNVTVKSKGKTHKQSYMFNYEKRVWELKPEDWEFEFFKKFNASQHILALKRDDACK